MSDSAAELAALMFVISRQTSTVVLLLATISISTFVFQSNSILEIFYSAHTGTECQGTIEGAEGAALCHASSNDVINELEERKTT